MEHIVIETIADPQNRLNHGGDPVSHRFPIFRPLGVRDFRLVWIGEAISLLGDQFYFVALAWLTLQLTGSGFALGAVLTAAAIPRAILMLLGGAVTDRVSPRTLMLISNIIRALVTMVLVASVSTHHIAFWQLVCTAVLFGAGDAFYFPASASIVPRLLDDDHLAAGNALNQANMQVTSLVGPAIAGVTIAVAGLTVGSAVAFAIDAATFVVAGITLLPIVLKPLSQEFATSASDHIEVSTSRDGLLSSIRAGLSYVWQDPVLRSLLVVTAVLNFGLSGSLSVGMAALAQFRFSQGAAGYGILVASFGLGGIIGTVLGGSMRRPTYLGRIIGVMGILIGICIGLFSVIPHLPMAVADCIVIDFLAGIVNVYALTWLQQRTAPHMMGRVFSVVLVCGQGLTPVSLAIAGVMVESNLSSLFLLYGAIIVAGGMAALASREVRSGL
jgi:MFS family permease